MTSTGSPRGSVCHWPRSRVTATGRPSRARAVFGRATAIEKNRGHVIAAAQARLAYESDVLVTVHPSFLLRVPDEDRDAAYQRFVDDLKLVRRYGS